jgi:hypothetical protein
VGVIAGRTVFSLQAAAARMQCQCGESELRVETDGVKFRLWVPCGICGKEHQAELSADALLSGRGVGLACPETGTLCCYCGEEAEVRRSLERLAITAAKDGSETAEAFTDNVIMYEVLSELRDIAARGGISCSCGSHRYSMKVHRGSVDLICDHCGGKLRLSAATDEDLDDLCCHMSLTIPGGAL